MPRHNSICEAPREAKNTIRPSGKPKGFLAKKGKNWVRRIVKRRNRKAAFFRW